MEQVESLSSILGDSPFHTGEPTQVDAAPPAAEVKEEAQPEPTAEIKSQTRDEKGQFAKVEEPTAEVKAETKEETADGRNVALSVARERYRRAEAALKDLQAKEAQAPKVSIFEDEDKGITQRLDEATRPFREANFNMSMKLARLTYKDEFSKAEGAFFDSAEADPRLYEQLRAAADPGEFIMTVGMQIAELAPVGGDFVKYREKVTGEFKTELGKRDDQIKALTAQIEALSKAQKELDAVPRSLNQVHGSAPKVTEADPEDINNIVRFKTG